MISHEIARTNTLGAETQYAVIVVKEKHITTLRMDRSLYDRLKSVGIPRPAEKRSCSKVATISRRDNTSSKRRKTSALSLEHHKSHDQNIKQQYPPLPPILTHPATYSTLQSQARLLYLLHVRNHNQHRRGFWYRSFGVLRREVGRLCQDLGVTIAVDGAEKADVPVKGKPKVGEKGWRDPEVEQEGLREVERKVMQRVGWWVEGGLVFRWHHAFTCLISTTQFAPLGLSLLAILARICNVTGCTAALSRLGEGKLVPTQQSSGERMEEDGEREDEDRGTPIARVEVL